jgi:hypothetical protein
MEYAKTEEFFEPFHSGPCYIDVLKAHEFAAVTPSSSSGKTLTPTSSS